MSALNKALDLGYKGKTRFHIEDPHAAFLISEDLFGRMIRYDPDLDRPKVLLCIGTDRSTGDCLGPLVGTKMEASGGDFFKVYGTLDQPVHASNLKEKLQDIQTNHEDPLVLAVDACLGQLENVGYVSIGEGALLPGAGVNKNLPPAGHLHITGTVNVGGFMEFMVLQNTRLNLVMRLADTIACGLALTIAKYGQKTARGI
ncbi:MAG: spore protease YyaC [Firmicutes bacterium]|nr:spore protease YyaC [Bacillota bacterium]